MMRMSSLQDLHQNMRQIGIETQRFEVRVGAAEFACLFSVAANPYCLALTTRGQHPQFCRFDVRPGYIISNYLGENYGPLRDALYVDGRAGEGLEGARFLAQLNDVIPHVAQQGRILQPEEIVRVHPNVDDADRPYFDRWERRGQGPTERNLQKTRIILGDDARTFSETNRVSSIWSQLPTNRAWR